MKMKQYVANCQKEAVMTYRDIYEKTYGPLPKGHICHHCDLDHSNDDPENLIAISKGLHIVFHRVIKWLSQYPDRVIRLGKGLVAYGERLKINPK